MELIYSTKDIFTKYLNSNEKYVIPAYQRGYKWKTKDIEQLLNDINAFQTHDDEVFYCLQNITLFRNGDVYNIVDGQQRLTTLALILTYLDKYDLIKGKLEYKIREETQNFMNEYVYSKRLYEFGNKKDTVELTLLEWDELDISDDYNYQDIFYIYNAYKTIQQWFIENDDVKEVMKDKILNRVKLIVNLPQISSSQELELFDNLNGKRVSLDGADLIRAMIITRVARKDVEDIDDTVKHDVILNETRVKNGLKLDEINSWWCVPERQSYYGVFVRNINSKGENIIFDEQKYPIDILYKLYIQTTNANILFGIEEHEGKNLKERGSGTIKLQYFENVDNISDVFAQLQDVQRLVEYWYEDAELYHLVLYSAIYLKKTFSKLSDLWYNNNRNDFVAQLKKEIKDNEFINLVLKTVDENGKELKDDQLNFKENWYDGDNTNMIPVMILLDVIRILSSKQTKFPIANLDPSHFNPQKEDKEHIFPQTPLEKGYDIATLKYYINVAYECGYKTYDKSRIMKIIDKYMIQIQKHESFRNWFNKKMTSELIPINSLGNVCLLHNRVNRSYGNDFFAQKHFDIMLKSSNGEYIRPHVLDAFTKIMAPDADRNDLSYMEQWTKNDIYSRRKHIVSQIHNFLK